jgi:hypothetical protein
VLINKLVTTPQLLFSKQKTTPDKCSESVTSFLVLIFISKWPNNNHSEHWAAPPGVRQSKKLFSEGLSDELRMG